MNKIYKTVYNRSRRTYVVVNEAATSYSMGGGANKALCLGALFLALSSPVQATDYVDFNETINDKVWWSKGDNVDNYTGSFNLDYTYQNLTANWDHALFRANDNGTINFGSESAPLESMTLIVNGIPKQNPTPYIFRTLNSGTINIFANDISITQNVSESQNWSVVGVFSGVDKIHANTLNVTVTGQSGMAGDIFTTTKDSDIQIKGDISLAFKATGALGATPTVIKAAQQSGNIQMESADGSVKLTLDIEDAVSNSIRVVDNSQGGSVTIKGAKGIEIVSSLKSQNGGVVNETVDNDGSLLFESSDGNVVIDHVAGGWGYAFSNTAGGNATVNALNGSIAISCSDNWPDAKDSQSHAVYNIGSLNFNAKAIDLHTTATTQFASAFYNATNTTDKVAKLQATDSVSFRSQALNSGNAAGFYTSSVGNSLVIAPTVTIAAEAPGQAIAVRQQGSGTSEIYADTLDIRATSGGNGAFALYSGAGTMLLKSQDRTAPQGNAYFVSEASGNALNHIADSTVEFGHQFSTLQSTSTGGDACGLRVQGTSKATFAGQAAQISATASNNAWALRVSGDASVDFAGVAVLNATAQTGGSIALDLAEAGTVTFKSAATLTGATAFSSAQGTTLTKSGTQDLVFNGLVNAQGKIDLQGGKVVFTDESTVSSLTSAQGSQIAKQGNGTLSIGLTDNVLRSDLFVEVGITKITNDQAELKGLVNIGSGASMTSYQTLTIAGDTAIDASGFVANSETGIIVSENGGTFAVSGSSLTIKNLKPLENKDDYYTLVSGFDSVGDISSWADSVSGNRFQNILMQTDEDGVILKVSTKSADEVFGRGIRNKDLINAISEDSDVLTDSGAETFFNAIVNDTAVSDSEFAVQVDSFFDLGILSGSSYASLGASNLAADVVTRHLRGTQPHVQGQDLWVDVSSSFDRIKNLDNAVSGYGLDADIYALTLGWDHVFAQDFIAGAALTAARTDIESLGSYNKTENTQDSYGLRLYAKKNIGEVAVIAQIGYLFADNDIQQKAYAGSVKASTDSHVFSAQASLELPFVTGDWEVIQYTGLRYSSVKTDGFTAKYNGVSAYQSGKQTNNLLQLPLGLRVARNLSVGSWFVKPMLDLTFTPTLGDDKLRSDITIGQLHAVSEEAQLVGRGVFSGALGVEATQENQQLRLNYRFNTGTESYRGHNLQLQYRYMF